MKSSFQTILIIVFIIGFVVAIAAFSGLFSSKTASTTSSTPTGQVVIWGVLPATEMQLYVDDFNGSNYGYTLSYSQHSPANFYQDLIVALANGTSPDLVMINSEQYAQVSSKLYTIPYSAYTERQYRDTNIDGAQMFLNTNGVGALPLLVDPLVTYYNKDILASKNFLLPPKTWDDLAAAVPILTKTDAKHQITQSAIALGESDNILHSRDILSALFLQTGNSIINTDKEVTLDNVATGASTSPAAEALGFYTSFSNPTTNVYSWNSSLPESLQNFLAGKSAFYIGRASELFAIQSQNPNLNFDVAQLFQSSATARPATYGSFLVVGIMAKAPNPVAAYAAANQIASSTSIDTLSKQFSLAPVRRDLLQLAQSNPYVSVFFQSALSAFSWPDPNMASTNSIFRDMITKVNSNAADTETAIYDATRDLQSSVQ